MRADLIAQLAELLYQHDKVALPGLGTFFVKRQAARRDPVQGVFLPPAREVQFNPNLLFDDGLLKQALVRQKGLTSVEASSRIQAFVAEAKAKLRQNESLELPQIGKLFSNLHGQIQFVSAEENFDAGTFGLPAVKAEPVSSPQRPVHTGPAVPPPAKPSWSSRIYHWFSKNVALLLFLTFLALAAVAYIAFGDQLFRKKEVAESQTEAQPKGVPVPEVPAYDSAAEKTTTEPRPEERDSEGITPDPGQKYFIIAVGMFREEENVNSAIQKIYADGYEPFIDKKGSLTRIGIQKAYTSQSEIQEALSYARSEFDPQSFVMKR
jgi:hypothetical protein